MRNKFNHEYFFNIYNNVNIDLIKENINEFEDNYKYDGYQEGFILNFHGIKLILNNPSLNYLSKRIKNINDYNYIISYNRYYRKSIVIHIQLGKKFLKIFEYRKYKNGNESVKFHNLELLLCIYKNRIKIIK